MTFKSQCILSSLLVLFSSQHDMNAAAWPKYFSTFVVFILFFKWQMRINPRKNVHTISSIRYCSLRVVFTPRFYGRTGGEMSLPFGVDSHEAMGVIFWLSELSFSILQQISPIWKVCQWLIIFIKSSKISQLMHKLFWLAICARGVLKINRSKTSAKRKKNTWVLCLFAAPLFFL